MCIRDWLPFITPAATVIAAAGATYVAHKFGTIQAAIGKQQAATAAAAALIARNKLRLDMLERRLAVVDGVNRMFGEAHAHGKLLAVDEVRYLQAIQPSRWLFDADVAAFLHEKLWRLICDLTCAWGLMDGMEGSPDWVKLVHARSDALTRLCEQQSHFLNLMNRFMMIEA